MLNRPVAGGENGLLRSVARPCSEPKATPRPVPPGAPGTIRSLPRCGSRSSHPGTLPLWSGNSKPGLSRTSSAAGISRAARRRRSPARSSVICSARASSNATPAPRSVAGPTPVTTRVCHGPNSNPTLPAGSGGSGSVSTPSNIRAVAPDVSSRARHRTGDRFVTTTAVPVAADATRTTSGRGVSGIVSRRFCGRMASIRASR